MFGVDLVDFFRGRHSWRKLKVLIDRMPASSAFVEAMQDDPEFAEQILARPPAESPSPPISSWTPEVARLTDIYDRLGEVVAGLVGLGGGKPPRLRPAPRPRTAVDRVRHERARSQHESLVDEVKQAQERWAARRG